MNKEDLKKLAGSGNYIEGIYNYCDRWCERCQFTSRCLNFRLGQKKFGNLDENDEMNEVFWQRFSEMLQSTISLLKEMAEERGIDLDAADIEENKLEKKISFTSSMAKNYIKLVDDWFNSPIGISATDEDELKSSKTQENEIKFEDIVQIIRWYQHQIYVKLERAIYSELHENSNLLNGFPKDSEGSAKVALIGIDRSIGAWGQMLKHFPYYENKIIKLISFLERLRQIVEKRFPKARDFIRPGFDEIKKVRN
jgi:hypothetical protein